MMASRLQIVIIAIVLIVFGMGLTLYKSWSLGLPLLPDKYQDVWTIESKISFDPIEEIVEVELALPQANNGWLALNENFASSGFEFSVVDEEETRKAKWTKQQLASSSSLYYKIQAYKNTGLTPLSRPPTQPPKLPKVSQEQSRAIEQFINRLKNGVTDEKTLLSLLLQELTAPKRSQEVQFIMRGAAEGNIEGIRQVLRFAGIDSQPVRGIQLQDGRRRQTLTTLLEAYTGGEWIILDPRNGNIGLPEDFFLWQRGGEAILTVAGAENSKLEFALVNNRLPIRTLVSMESKSKQFALLDFSIYSLPIEEQGVFKGLLLIPVAALVVVLTRVLVGLSTSGTFMPILISLAFIQTTLLAGLTLFILVLSIGLWIRSYLSHMNLLLVSRVTSVVIVVILLMAAVAVLSYKLGIDQALSVTFFPTIILAWTIERMSVLWEEEGGHEVFVQGGGSLLVAVLAYLVMINPYVAHLTFNFPELLIALLGVVLLLGKYTGYRLSELYRFRELKKQL